MPVGIQTFDRAASLGGAMHFDSEDPSKLKSFGTGFFGRAVVWFRGTGSAAVNPNAQVARQFLAAVKSEFGEAYALRAGRQIDQSGVKPLLARDVRRVIDQGRLFREDQAKDVEVLASAYADDRTVGSNTILPTFGDLLSKALATHLPGVRVEDVETGAVQRSIRKELVGSSEGGRRILYMRDAQDIADKKIAVLIENKLELLNRVESLPGALESDKAIIRRFALQHDISNPQSINQLWLMRHAAVELFQAMAIPSTSDEFKMEALAKFQQRYDEALTPLISGEAKENFGADDLTDFTAKSIELGALLSNFTETDLENVYSELTSPETSDLRGTMLRAYYDSAEEGVGIGTESTSKLRSFNDTIGALIQYSGESLKKSNEEVAEANSSSTPFETIDQVPPSCMDALRNVGLTDVNYSLEKQVDRLAEGTGKTFASQALRSIESGRSLASEPDLARRGDLYTAQARIFAEHRDRIDSSDLPPGLKAQLCSRLEASITDCYGNAHRDLIQAGASEDKMLAFLNEARDGLDQVIGRMADGSTKGRCKEQRIKFQSEIFTREDPQYRALAPGPMTPENEREMNLDNQSRMIQNRYEYGKIITNGLRFEFAKEIDSGSLGPLRERSGVVRNEMEEIRQHRGYEGVAGDRARERINQLRTGSSDTISGKSGGGEVSEGKSLALRNWNEAASFASEIGRTGMMITLDQIRDLNRIINKDLPANEGVPGQYRQRPETAGGGAAYPQPERVPELMDEFMEWLNTNFDSMDPAELAGMAYQKLVSIHPFDDGNGRTCRLVVDTILESKGYPPASFQGSDEFNVAVFGVPQKNQVQLGGLDAIQRTMNAIERSVQIYRQELAQD